RRAAELSHVRQQPGECGVPWRQLPSLPADTAELSHVRQQPGGCGGPWRQLPSLPAVPRSCRTCDSSRGSAACLGDSSPPCPPCRGAVARATAAGGVRRALATAPLLARRAAELSHVRQQPGECGVPWRQLPSLPAVPRSCRTCDSQHYVLTLSRTHGNWTVCGQALIAGRVSQREGRSPGGE